MKKKSVKKMSEKSIIAKLLDSTEPAIRLKTYIRLLDYNYEAKEVKKLITDIKVTSPIIANIFKYLIKDESSKTFHVYTKWQGAHWLLSTLADVGYPPGDESLLPSIDREMKWLLFPTRWANKPVIDGRRRNCASQDGNGLYATLLLGFYDERCDTLAERLIQSQWPDGGWNCDKNPAAVNSSYHESLIPLRALNAYKMEQSSSQLQEAIDKASELFLKRKLFKRLSDGGIINNRWLLLHYPPYWRYDVLMALKVLAEVGKIHDKRCVEALELLESKRLADGGFPREGKYCQTSNPDARQYSPGDWMGVNKKKMNEWITIDALYVLKSAKRTDIDF
jgi:hypothetical protein